jgi:23S rRNA (adenine2030-N6)-methyltransferase
VSDLLSYRHSYHAGNFADVIKHLTVVEIFRHLLQKDSAFHYFDTHAGAGVYDLRSEHATKLHEHREGISRLSAREWPELETWFAAIDAVNHVHVSGDTMRFYPGSPVLAQHFLRRQDKAWLFELHSQDRELLAERMRRDRRVRVIAADGFQGVLALLPPVTRRGFVLIDPSYEIKHDFETVVEIVAQAHRKFSTGIYAIWYPVVERRRVEALERRLVETGIRNIQRFELAVAPDSAAGGMRAAGMIVINPPWTLRATMSTLLPRLVDTLAQGDGAFFRCDTLVDE